MIKIISMPTSIKMTEQEILKKAIEKAVENGYNGWDIDQIITDYRVGNPLFVAVIFSHDFAKAFWGESEHKVETMYFFNDKPEPTEVIEIWQFHLQQMVISENPIKYLEQFLK
jgi:hypothetical protein